MVRLCHWIPEWAAYFSSITYCVLHVLLLLLLNLHLTIIPWEPMKTLKLHYPMIQFIIISFILCRVCGVWAITKCFDKCQSNEGNKAGIPTCSNQLFGGVSFCAKPLRPQNDCLFIYWNVLQVWHCAKLFNSAACAV